MDEEKKIYTLGNLVKSLEDCLQQRNITCRINMHNKKSYHKDTVFSTAIMPMDKALQIFGDVEIMYSRLDTYTEDEHFYPCVNFGVVIE